MNDFIENEVFSSYWLIPHKKFINTENCKMLYEDFCEANSNN